MQPKITKYVNMTQKNGSEDSFQETEIGLIPEDWEVVTLGDLFDLQQGKAMSPKARLGISPQPFLRTVNVLWGRIDLSTLDYMDFTEDEMARLRLQPDDLLVCEGGEIGRTAIWRGEVEVCGYQNHIHRLRKSRKDIQPEFYMYWMQAAFLILHLYAGEAIRTTIPNLSGGRLKSFLVPKPPLLEQQKIAKVLSTIQRAIEQQHKIIEAAKNLKKSLMQKLFTEGLGHTEFNETEIGEIPKSWEMAKLAEVCEVKGGKRLHKGHRFASAPTPYPYIRVVDFRNNSVNKDDLKFLTPQDYQLLKRYTITQEDVYISIAGTTGIVGIIPEDLDCAVLTENAAKLLINNQEKLLKYFLVYFLASDAGQIQIYQQTTKAVQPKLALGRIKQIVIPLPPLFEQKEIARILSIVDKKIEVEAKREATLKELFKTTLHKLMTGEIRLKDVEV